MIITRTPFRISFFGGGTDYPSYYYDHGGAVLSTTINKYCYIFLRFLPPFFEYKFRIRYTNTEYTNHVEEIVHPSVRACLQFLDVQEGVEIVHSSDIPAMSGIGSSSAFTVGMLKALYALTGQMITKRKLAFDAIHVEQRIIEESVGSQDQVAAAFGGFNRIFFRGTDDIQIEPVTLGKEKFRYLQDRLMFFFTGFPRVASHVASRQIAVTSQKLTELNNLKNMVGEAVRILCGPPQNLDDFGRLLHESWQIKRSLTPLVSTAEIDKIYEQAVEAGALGGKLCGAGGGGFLLLYVPLEKQDLVREKLRHLLLVPFRFEDIGSHVAFYSS